VELFLIDDERHTRWVTSPAKFSRTIRSTRMSRAGGVLGWRLPSREGRHGDNDVVDPDLADLDRLPVPNAKWNLGHSTGAFGTMSLDGR
jgi:hypothetical protein